MIKFITKDTSIDEYQSEIQLSTIEECVEYCQSKSILGVDTETEVNGGRQFPYPSLIKPDGQLEGKESGITSGTH